MVNEFINASKSLLYSRIEIIFFVSWMASLSVIMVGSGLPPVTESLISILAVLMLTISVYIYNDIIDRKQDAYSKLERKKMRPLVTGKVSVENAMRFVYLTGLIGLGLCYFLGRLVFGIGLIFFSFLILYSHPSVRFKEGYVLKTAVSSLLLPTAFILPAAAVTKTISLYSLFLGLEYYLLIFFFSPAIADMNDMEEDLAFNIKTIGNQLSKMQNLILLNLGIFVVILGSLVAYLLFDISYYVPIITTVVGILNSIYTYRIRNENSIDLSIKLRKPMYLYILLFNPLLMILGSII